MSAVEVALSPAVFAFLSGVLFLFLLTLAIGKWYQPDIAHLIGEVSERLTPMAASSLLPEPVERMQFLSSLLLGPCFILASFWLSQRIYRNARRTSQLAYERLAGMILAGTGAVLPIFTYYALKTSNFMYIRSGVLFTHPGFYSLLFFPCAVLLVVFEGRRLVSLAVITGLYAVSIHALLLCSFFSVFDRDSISPWTYHLNPVIYPLAQVMAGKTLLVDCSALYGLYPHFLQPIFEIIPLSVHSFTTAMSGILTVCFIAIWLFVRLLTKNNIVMLAGFAAVVFYPHIGAKLMGTDRPDPYFQYMPIRILFPCLLLVLVAAWLRGAAKCWTYHVTFLFAAASILWNPDSGLVVFGTWTLLLGYTELSTKTLRDSVKPVIWHALFAGGHLSLVFGGYSLFCILRSGALPDWSMSAEYYELFARFGYFMLPMRGLPHLWAVVVAVYIGAMTVAMHALLNKTNQYLGSTMFFLTVMGAGLFGYYQGRSHDLCLIPVLYVPIIIVTILIDRLIEALKERRAAGCWFLPPGIVCFYFLVSAVPSMYAHSPRVSDWVTGAVDASPEGSGGYHSRNIEFIRGHVKPGERIFIWVAGNVEGMYYAETSTGSALDIPSSTDWFFRSDFDQVMRFLGENHDAKIFVSPQQVEKLGEGFRRSYAVKAQELETGLTMLMPVAAAGSDGPP